MPLLGGREIGWWFWGHPTLSLPNVWERCCSPPPRTKGWQPWHNFTFPQTWLASLLSTWLQQSTCARRTRRPCGNAPIYRIILFLKGLYLNLVSLEVRLHGGGGKKIGHLWKIPNCLFPMRMHVSPVLQLELGRPKPLLINQVVPKVKLQTVWHKGREVPRKWGKWNFELVM